MTNENKSEAGEELNVDFSQLEVGADGVTTIAEGETGSMEQANIAKLTAERDDFQDKYLRALADAENIRKRAMKERSDLLKYQGEQIVADLLTVFDDFELALANPGADLEKFRQGIEMIHKRFMDALSKWDIKGESALGKPFDPSRHEALGKVVSAESAPGSVINELKRAFYYKDKLIRPGQVIVAAGEEG